MSDNDVQRLAYAADVRTYLRGVVEGTIAGRLSFAAIAKGAGVSRTPLSTEAESCDVIKALRVDIRDARKDAKRRASEASRPSSDSAGDTPPTTDESREHARRVAKPGLDTLGDDAIATRIRMAKRRAQKAMETWLGSHGRLAAVDDAWLAWDDMERLVWKLRKVADELGPLLELRETRKPEESSPPPPAGIVPVAQPTLGL